MISLIRKLQIADEAIEYIANIIVAQRNPSGAYSGGTEFAELPEHDLKGIPDYSQSYYRTMVEKYLKHRNFRYGIDWARQGGPDD